MGSLTWNFTVYKRRLGLLGYYSCGCIINLDNKIKYSLLFHREISLGQILQQTEAINLKQYGAKQG